MEGWQIIISVFAVVVVVIGFSMMYNNIQQQNDEINDLQGNLDKMERKNRTQDLRLRRLNQENQTTQDKVDNAYGTVWASPYYVSSWYPWNWYGTRRGYPYRYRRPRRLRRRPRRRPRRRRR